MLRNGLFETLPVITSRSLNVVFVTHVREERP